MNDFNSIFEELSKLYDETKRDTLAESKKIKRSQIDHSKFDLKQMKYAEMKPGMYMGDSAEVEGEFPDDVFELIKSVKRKGDDYIFNYGFMDNDQRDDDGTYWVLVPKTVHEDFDDEETELVDNETSVEEPVEEPVMENEPRQVICECNKCGALAIRDEADIVIDKESDLANVEDECQFCEEANGFKIVGVVAPYEATEEAVAVEEALEEGIFDKKNSADTNNALREWEGKVKEVTDGKTLTDIAGDFISAINDAISEYSQYIYDTYEGTSVDKFFETQAKIVIKLHEEAIKSLSKPANFYAPYSIIVKVIRKITGQSGTDSDALARIEGYNVLNKVNSIEADKKIKAVALQNFGKAIITGLNNNLQRFKKLPYPGAMFKK